MKKTFYKSIFPLLALAIIFSYTVVLAQPPPTTPTSGYVVLAPLPGIGGAGNPAPTLSSYLIAVFNLAIGLAALAAFVMITFGGIMYATSDAVSQTSLGKEYIKNALWGLLLVIGAYAILYTINPKMLSFQLTIPRPMISTPPPTVTASAPGTRINGVLAGYTLTPAEVLADQNLRTQLGLVAPLGVTVNNDPCATGETVGCTNVVGLPPSAINGLTNLETTCRCLIQITGGTEGGHASHGPGLPVVDLSPTSTLNSYLAKTNPLATSNIGGLVVSVGGAIYTYEKTGDNGRATAPHWHVVFQ